ncbi:hypothetical protein EMCRGX_G020166 [Ephydatia muelleri]
MVFELQEQRFQCGAISATLAETECSVSSLGVQMSEKRGQQTIMKIPIHIALLRSEPLPVLKWRLAHRCFQWRIQRGCSGCLSTPLGHTSAVMSISKHFQTLKAVPPSAATSLAVSSDDVSSANIDLTRDEQPCSSGLAQVDINDLDHDNQFCNPPAAKCPALEITDCSEVAIFVRSSSISAQSLLTISKRMVVFASHVYYILFIWIPWAYLVKSWLAKSLPACKHTDWTCPICEVRHMMELETWLHGSVNVTAALIAAQYPLALYIHCASHCLNLAVVKSLQVTSVRNMGVVDKVFKFLSAHPKRHMALKRAISQTQPESSVHKLKDLCHTRWVQRIDGLEVFCSLYQSTVTCLESICNDGPRLWTSDSVTDARTLQLVITMTDFLSALVMTNFCLKYLQALTSNLQAETKDIVVAVKEINYVIMTL